MSVRQRNKNKRKSKGELFGRGRHIRTKIIYNKCVVQMINRTIFCVFARRDNLAEFKFKRFSRTRRITISLFLLCESMRPNECTFVYKFDCQNNCRNAPKQQQMIILSKFKLILTEFWPTRQSNHFSIVFLSLSVVVSELWCAFPCEGTKLCRFAGDAGEREIIEAYSLHESINTKRKMCQTDMSCVLTKTKKSFEMGHCVSGSTWWHWNRRNRWHPLFHHILHILSGASQPLLIDASYSE